MRTFILVAMMLALAGSACTDDCGWTSLLGSLASGGQSSADTVGEVAGPRATPSSTDSPDGTGQPAPMAGTIQAVVRNTTEFTAQVTIRFLLNNIVVHFSELRIEGNTTTAIVGPELAQLVEFSGTDHAGGDLTPRVFVYGADVDEDNPAVYVISDEVTPEPEPEPEQPLPDDEDDGGDEDEDDGNGNDNGDGGDEDEDDGNGGSSGGGGGDPVVSPDCNHNGILDSSDIYAGTSYDLNGNGIPDECDDCNGNGTMDSLDISLAQSPDCNYNQVPDECDIAAGTSYDCNVNGVPDWCDIAYETSSDGDENGVPDECQDCNDNGWPDGHDIAYGSSADCNYNMIPDECDVAEGTSDDANSDGVPDECHDCDSNGIPDVQEIAAGTADDCNENGVPDQCEIDDDSSLDANWDGILDECQDCNENSIPDMCDLTCDSAYGCDYFYCGGSSDCNANALPDECDIAAGTSLDDNGNGVPDECESPLSVLLYAVETDDPVLYALDPDEGILTVVVNLAWGPSKSGGPVYGLQGIAFAPDASYTLYGVVRDYTGGFTQLVIINPLTGIVLPIGKMFDSISDIAFTVDGTLYGVINDGTGSPGEIVIIDPNTAIVQYLDPPLLGAGGDVHSIATGPTGDLLYHIGCVDGCMLETIAPITGTVSPVNQNMWHSAYEALTYDPGGARLLGADWVDGAVTIVEIDPPSGSESWLSDPSTVSEISGLSFGPSAK